METNININEKCTVKLTQSGANWLNEYNEKRKKLYIDILSKVQVDINTINKLFPVDFKENDIHTVQIWNLMQEFGEYFYIETTAPFVNNEIKF